MKTLLKFSLMLVPAIALMLASCEKNAETKPARSSDSTFTFAAIGNEWVMGYDTTMPKAFKNDTLIMVASQGSYTWLMNDSSVMYCSSNEFGLEKEGNIFTICKADAILNDIFPGVAGDCRIAAVDLPVTVPAGTFLCFKVERSIGGEHRETYYVNRQYGLIKVENEEYIRFLVSFDFDDPRGRNRI